MQMRQISEISATARAAVGCMKLPEHVRSLAATIEKMANRAVTETSPDPATIYTLEQAIGILERWVAGYDIGDDGVNQLTGGGARQGAGTIPAVFPPQFPAL